MHFAFVYVINPILHYYYYFFFKGIPLFLFYLFIYFWLCWVFVSVQGLSLVAASGGHSSLRCAGLSLSRPLLLQSTGSRCAGSVVVAHGPSCSAACGIFPDQGSNLCPLHWQADSRPLRHQGSPYIIIFASVVNYLLNEIEIIRKKSYICLHSFHFWCAFVLFLAPDFQLIEFSFCLEDFLLYFM